jgi:hypothetical protein
MTEGIELRRLWPALGLRDEHGDVERLADGALDPRRQEQAPCRGPGARPSVLCGRLRRTSGKHRPELRTPPLAIEQLLRQLLGRPTGTLTLADKLAALFA